MKAAIGDVIVVPGRHVGDHERRGTILEVHGPDGAPPYLVRWGPDDHEGIFVPAAGAAVVAGPQNGS